MYKYIQTSVFIIDDSWDNKERIVSKLTYSYLIIIYSNMIASWLIISPSNNIRD